MTQPSDAHHTPVHVSDPAIAAIPAADDADIRDKGRTIVTSGYSIAWPKSCCCCLGPTNASLPVWGMNQRMTHSKTWNVPYCLDCTEHLRTRNSLDDNGPLILFSWSAGVLLFFLFATYSNSFVLTLLFSIGIVWSVYALARWFRRQPVEGGKKPACACEKAAVHYVGWHGTTHYFRMHNPAYIALFLEENRGRAALNE